MAVDDIDVRRDPLLTLPGPVASVAISPDGRVLVAASADGVVALADLELYAETFRWSFAAGTPVAVSAAMVAATDGRRLRVENTLAGRSVASVRVSGAISALAFSSDGSALAVGTAEAVQVHRAVTGKRVARLDVGVPVRALCFGPGDRLAVATADQITVHNVRTLAPDAGPPIPLAAPIQQLRFADGLSFAADTRAPALVWVGGGRLTYAVLDDHVPMAIAEASWVAVDPLPRRTGFIVAGGDRVDVWTAGGEQCHTFRPGGVITSASLHPHGRALIVGLEDGAVRVWDLRTADWRT